MCCHGFFRILNEDGESDMSEEKKVLTIKECSELYKIGINRLRELCRMSSCPFIVRIGSRKVLIKAKAFDDWFNACECI